MLYTLVQYVQDEGLIILRSFIHISMTLDFESTHEYYLKDAQIWYCEEHSGLVISRDYEDRVVINGLKPETVLEFAQKIVTNSLEKEVPPKKKATAK